MKIKALLILCFALAFTTSCRRSNDEVWDDTKTCGRHVKRGFKSLGGKHGDSRQVRRKEDFMSSRDDFCAYNPSDWDFEPLADQEVAMADINYSKSTTHAEPGQSFIPGIEGFRNPKDDPYTRDIFRNVQFPYNSSLVKGSENMEIIRGISNYLKSHPNTYIFVEGHCDQRGAEAYNLALGSRRCNAVRNMLIKEGVRPEVIFTVSYGKERPIDPRNTEDAWAINRRSEFKTFNSRS